MPLSSIRRGDDGCFVAAVTDDLRKRRDCLGCARASGGAWTGFERDAPHGQAWLGRLLQRPSEHRRSTRRVAERHRLTGQRGEAG